MSSCLKRKKSRGVAQASIPSARAHRAAHLSALPEATRHSWGLPGRTTAPLSPWSCAPQIPAPQESGWRRPAWDGRVKEAGKRHVLCGEVTTCDVGADFAVTGWLSGGPAAPSEGPAVGGPGRKLLSARGLEGTGQGSPGSQPWPLMQISPLTVCRAPPQGLGPSRVDPTPQTMAPGLGGRR